MIKQSRIFALALASVLLASCGHSVESLAEDSEARRQILKECLDKGMAAKDDALCKMAAEAEALAMKNAAKGMIDSIGK